MHQIVPRETAANPEPFTGERLTGSIHGQVEVEHYHRYLFARAFCHDKVVIDVASGEGYGTALLSQVAAHVVGVEYAGPTARNAAANFARPNLSFVQGDARSLPLADASADIVVSFETIEHFEGQEDFVAEVRRVLRPDGRFIVSTPDREVYSPPGSSPNPFHVREFDRYEFLDLLHRHFLQVALVRQRPVLGSALIPEEASSVAPLLFGRRDDTSFSLNTVLPDAPYLIAIANNLSHAPEAVPVSLLIERSDLDNVHFASRDQELHAAQIDAGAARAAAIEARTAAREAEAAAEKARTTASEALRTLDRVTAETGEQLDAERHAAEQARLEARERVENARLAIERVEAEARLSIARAEAEAREQVEAARRAEARAWEELEEARRIVGHYKGESERYATTLASTRAVLEETTRELDHTSGSARRFLSRYLPKLRRHLTGGA